MPRSVLPGLMTMQLGSLPGSVGKYALVQQRFGAMLAARAQRAGEPGIPVSLRWSLNPVVGFPRSPFEVWRRVRHEEPTEPVLGVNRRTAPATLALPNEVIELRFDAAPGPNGMTIEALSRDGRVLPGQRHVIVSQQSCRFRAAGIAGVRLRGTGSISGIGAIVQSEWANLPDWIRIEVVGFPFEPGELPTAVYDPAKQGWEAPTHGGVAAALLRLGVAELLQLDPPTPSGLPVPSWPFPDPKIFLDVLRKGPLAHVAACLLSSDDTDPLNLQSLHTMSRQLPGLHQPTQTAGEPANLTVATTGYIALAAHDGPVALGLGFGTTDVPQARASYISKDVLPPGTELGSDEYLVSANFRTPFGDFELAAIGHRAAPPELLTKVITEQTFANRAMTRDAAESVALRVSWSAPRLYAGVGLLVDMPANPPLVFNTPRPAGAGGYQPYLTDHRFADDGNPPDDLRPSVTMPDQVVPTSGTAITTYAVAALDAFGRWGPWAVTSHATSSRPVQPPGLGEVSLALPAALPTSGPVAAGCTLTVEVSWDWADRSPYCIEVSGAFTPVGPPPGSVSGFAVSSTLAPLPVPVTIGFAAGLPMIMPAPPGSAPSIVALLQSASVAEIKEPGAPPGAPAPSSAGSQVRRYRLKIPNLSVSFATVDELGYAVTARAAEQIRATVFSASTGPRATAVANPFPAAPPTLPAVTVLWTAQPDASGRARTVLSWPAVPGASGYIVWEATEAALSFAVAGTPVAGSLRTRAVDLKARVAANHLASVGAFSRVNERPLSTTSIELVLPGSADTLFAYRLSSITAQNIESAKTSDIVCVAVPHRDVPGTPRLEARGSSADAQVTLIAVPGAGRSPNGDSPAAVRIYCVRRELLADQVGTMGPPRISASTAGLPLVAVPARSGLAEKGWQFVDTVDPSWTPYYYRCVTVGHDAHDDGVWAADSPPSATVPVLVHPPLKPLLTAVTRGTGSAGTLIGFRTDLPFVLNPAGDGKVTISVVTGTTRTVRASLSSMGIAVAAALTATGPAATAVRATRTVAVNGVSEVTVLVPAASLPVPTASIVVTVTDPFGRSTSVEVV